MKLAKVIGFAGLAVLVGAVGAYAAETPAAQQISEANVCKLIENLGSTFRVLRTMAFGGAAFLLAGWAWAWIAKGFGSGGDGTDLEGAKKKGIGFAVGFSILFGIAVIMQFLPDVAGCQSSFNTWTTGTSSVAQPVANP